MPEGSGAGPEAENPPYRPPEVKKSPVSLKAKIGTILREYGLRFGGPIAATLVVAACGGEGDTGSGVTIVEQERPSVVVVEKTPETTKTPFISIGREPTTTPIVTVTPTVKHETPTTTPAVEKPVTQFTRYENLEKKIESSALSAADKAQYRTQIENLKSVERVQAQFMEAYLSATGPDGKTPELLYYLQQKWPAMPDFSPEQQIFFIRNQAKLESVIRPKIDGLAANFSKAGADEIFLAINQNMANVGFDGSDYFGIEFSMADYLRLAKPEQLPKTEIDYSGLTPEQKAKMVELQEKLAPLVGRFKLVAQANGESVSTFNPYLEVMELYINFADRNIPAHELVHALDVALRKEYKSPEQIVKSYVLREKGLSDPEGGRRYSTVEELFSDPIKGVPEGARQSYTIAMAFGDLARKDASGKLVVKDSTDPRRPSNIAITEQRFKEITGQIPATAAEVKYYNTEMFLKGEKQVLDKLCGESPYFAAVIAWFRANPSGVDNLIKKTVPDDAYSLQVSATQSREAYFQYLKYGSDGIFATTLINGERSAVDFYNSVTKERQKGLRFYILSRLNAADYETFAVMSVASLTNDGPAYQPYKEYFSDLRQASGN